MDIRHVFHFPDGKVNYCIDMEYCFSQINIGEKIVIEDDPIVYKVSDIQNQFQSVKNDNKIVLKMLIRNVILSRDYEKFPMFSVGK